MTLYLAFSSGGFFAGAPAVAATCLGALLVIRILAAPDPFVGLGPAMIAAIACLGLYGVWTLCSAFWSDAPAQAMIEFNRVLLYWMALVLFGSFPHDRRTLEWAARTLAITIGAIAVIALITRLLPDVWSAPPAEVDQNRLSFPLTYWNALGILTGVGIVLCSHFACEATGSRGARVVSTAALPPLVTALYFTFSRGAIACTVVGLLVYLAFARPRGLPSAMISAVPFAGVALLVSYQADLLANGAYASPDGVAQGHRVALVTVGCIAAAALSRYWLVRILDPRLVGWNPSAASRQRFKIFALVLVLCSIGGALALEAPSKLADQYDSFTSSEAVNDSGDLRNRLVDVGNNGRLAQWRVALDAFGADPLNGEGAGTYARIWARNGEEGLKVEDAHSLYIEVLAELGIPGLFLLGTALVTLLVSLAMAARRPDARLHAALFAAGVAWAIHAGVDWDWEMPATGLWLFALSGLALSRPTEVSPQLGTPGRFGRLALGAGCLALLVTPALMALSQASLNNSVDAFNRGDCAAASTEALAAARWVSARPEPFQILSYCNSRAGDSELAIEIGKTAVDRDPNNWESYYGLALVQAVAGEDPRPAARRALELSPNAPLAQAGVDLFSAGGPAKWRRRALQARLPIQ